MFFKIGSIDAEGSLLYEELTFEPSRAATEIPAKRRKTFQRLLGRLVMRFTQQN
jgi:hypothetical protein